MPTEPRIKRTSKSCQVQPSLCELGLPGAAKAAEQTHLWVLDQHQKTAPGVDSRDGCSHFILCALVNFYTI